MMLRKTPSTRPGLDRIATLLTQLSTEPDGSPGLNALAEAGAVIAQREGIEDARSSEARFKEGNRDQIAKDANQILRTIGDSMIDRVVALAPTAKRAASGMSVLLGDAALEIVPLGKTLQVGSFGRSKWDVILGASIRVRQAQPRYEWSASLWYAKIKDAQDYRWHEVSYMVNPLARSERERHQFAPFSLSDDIPHADEAAAPSLGMFQFAWGPETIDDEDTDKFHDRWANLLARAARGQISYPRNLPLQ